jgi:hypothetical protein
MIIANVIKVLLKVISENGCMLLRTHAAEWCRLQDKICDARFSNCCGGVMKIKRGMAPVHGPYLVAVKDVDLNIRRGFLHTSDPEIFATVFDFDQSTVKFYR